MNNKILFYKKNNIRIKKLLVILLIILHCVNQ